MKQLSGQLEVTLTLSLLAGQHDGATFSFEQTEPPPAIRSHYCLTCIIPPRPPTRAELKLGCKLGNRKHREVTSFVETHLLVYLPCRSALCGTLNILIEAFK